MNRQELNVSEPESISEYKVGFVPFFTRFRNKAFFITEKILDSILDLNIDFCEIQLDNPIFKFKDHESKAIKLIDKLFSKDLQLSFHLSFIDLNIASLDSEIRCYSSRLLRKEIKFVKKWKPLYIVVHTGKISDTFYKIPSIKEQAHKQQIKTISDIQSHNIEM